jgi:hypothetical protein
MTATNEFFNWFFYGLGGLGGWFIFLLLALIADVWLIYDSSKRRLPAVGWRIGVIILTLLILPALLYRFTVDPTDPVAAAKSPLAPYSEIIFYLGLLGGVLPPVLALGYFVTYRGMVGCTQGHVYETALGKCPECARQAPAPGPIYIPQAPKEQVSSSFRGDGPSVSPPPPSKPKVQAWLTAEDGHSYQLCAGETTIGRASRNDIQLPGDTTLSKEHVKIIEQNGRFQLIDLGSTNGTRVNGKLVRQPILLEPDDQIQFGDNTVVRFVTAYR